MRTHSTVSLIVALAWTVSTQVNPERELKLAAGPFPQIAGSELGQSVAFENEIDLHTCFPLLMKGEIVTWIHRAHAVSRRLLVQRCVEYDPSIDQTRGSRHGGVRESWDWVVIGGDRHRLDVCFCHAQRLETLRESEFLWSFRRVLGHTTEHPDSVNLRCQVGPCGCVKGARQGRIGDGRRVVPAAAGMGCNLREGDV